MLTKRNKSNDTMDWNNEQIGSGEFTHYEHASLGKKSNRYSSFQRCAYSEYHMLDEDGKQAIILLVMGRKLVSTDVSLRRIVQRVWKNMATSTRNAWNDRALRLRNRHVPGQFRVLPANTPAYRDGLLCDCLREETVYMKETSRRAMVYKGTSDLHKKKFNLPHQIQVGTFAYRCVTMSPLMRKLMVAYDCPLKPWENVGRVKIKFPRYIHLSSLARVQKVLAIDDMVYSTYHDHKTESTYYLTSLAILGRAGQTTSTHGYGWSETDSTVTFIYRDTVHSTSLVSFPRPTLESTIVRVHSKNRKRMKYVMPTCEVDGLYVKSYTPASIYFSAKHQNNFKFICSRLCIRTNENGTILINPSKSS